VLAVWQPSTASCHYISVGDSRLYLVGAGGAAPMTEDDSRPVVVKCDGDIVLQAGSVATRNALTRALGAAQPLEFSVQSLTLAPGELIALVTDGCYELPGFDHRLLDLQNHADLDSGARSLIFTHHDTHGADDATLILLRRTDLPAEACEPYLAAVADDVDFRQRGLIGHLMATCVAEQMADWAAVADTARLEAGIDYLVRHDLRPKRDDVLEVLNSLDAGGDPEFLRLQRKLVDWARRL
jgi:hypothetical protein